jgi:hypothetical protein
MRHIMAWMSRIVSERSVKPPVLFRIDLVMNSVVYVVFSALWAVAYVLCDAEAEYSSRAMIVPGVTTADAAVIDTPASRQLRSWLARRLSSPPGALRSRNA